MSWDSALFTRDMDTLKERLRTDLTAMDADITALETRVQTLRTQASLCRQLLRTLDPPREHAVPNGAVPTVMSNGAEGRAYADLLKASLKRVFAANARDLHVDEIQALVQADCHLQFRSTRHVAQLLLSMRYSNVGVNRWRAPGQASPVTTQGASA